MKALLRQEQLLLLYGGRGRRHEEKKNSTRLTVLLHIRDVNGITKVPLAFCCPFVTEEK